MAIDDWMTEDDKVRLNVILTWPGTGLDYVVCWINLRGDFCGSECAMIFLDTQGLVWIDYYCGNGGDRTHGLWNSCENCLVGNVIDFVYHNH